MPGTMTDWDLTQLRVDLRRLAYLATIYECRSISAAAAKLGVAQPSLSEAVSRLEKELGFQLVVRTVRGIEFTDAGAALAKLGQNTVSDVLTGLTRVELLGHEDGGAVSICIPPAFSISLGVQLAETVKLQYPNIQLGISEVMSLAAQEGVAKGDHDLAIIYHGPTLGEFVVHPLMDEDFFLATAQDNWEPVETHEGIAVKPISFKHVAALPLVLPKRPNGLRLIMERNARKANLNLNIAFEIDSLRNVLTIVGRASAYGIIPHAVAGREIRNGELILIPIEEPKIVGSSQIIRKIGRPISSASLILERLIREILSEQIKRYQLRAVLQANQTYFL